MTAADITMMAVFLIWTLVMMGVGIVAARRMHGMEGFFLGGRTSGAWVTAISASTSSESGWLVIGLVGVAYLLGVKAIWIPVGCLSGFIINWFLVAPRLRVVSRRHNSLTVPDLLESVTGDRTGYVRLIAVCITLVLMFVYVAAQFMAAGKAFQATFHWPYWTGVLVGAIATAFYTTVGGYRAVAWTDLLQGLAMSALLLAVPLMAIREVGGISNLISSLNEQRTQVVHVLEGEFQGESVRFRLDRQHRLEASSANSDPVLRLVPDTETPPEGLKHIGLRTVVRRADDRKGTADGEQLLIAGAPLTTGEQRLLWPGDRLTWPGKEFQYLGKIVSGKHSGMLSFRSGRGPLAIAPGPLALDEKADDGSSPLDRPDDQVQYDVDFQPVLFSGADREASPVEGDVNLGGAVLHVAGTETQAGGKDALGLLGTLSGWPLFGFLLGMIGIGLGYPGAPHVLVRFMAAEGGREIRRGRIIALIWGTFALFGAVLMGLCARVLFPTIEDPEFGLMAGSRLLLHPVLAGAALAAAIAAMRSTADSQLLVASSTVARDFIQKVLRKDPNDASRLFVTRMTVIVLCLAALGFALGESRVVFWFLMFAWAGLGAAFGPVLILGLFSRRPLQPVAAASGMIVGLFVTVLWKLWLKGAIEEAGGPSVYELPPAFFSAFIVTWIVHRTLYLRRSVTEPDVPDAAPGDASNGT